ncbi:meteorin-like protein [Montipora foliosa]|uniref:meteorin-like protein n=1 Tax=Montipora foliosa TaxID=591990 RepID=UPI0035F1E3FF
MGAAWEAHAVFCWFALLYSSCVYAFGLDERCIWRGRGIPHTEQPSVVSIESTCHQGELHWTNPFGGLRVTFNPRMKVLSDFKLCFTARHPGVMIYREDFKGLTLVSGDSEIVTKRAICIKSKSGQIPVLYLETQQNQTLTQVNYTVFVNGRKRPRHPRTKECRPCKSSALLRSLCESDFAVRGYIHPMFPVENGQSEQANIAATEIIRQKIQVFNKNETAGIYAASVKIPSGCHWEEMKEYLFILTGDLESGKGPVLKCHVKETIWLKLKKESILHLCSKPDNVNF